MNESQATSPGITSASTAARPDVTATMRNAGTASRFAKGAASDTCWKLMAAIGSVNAMEAKVMVVTSRVMRAIGTRSGGGVPPERLSKK
jgi:hypothetical protein